MQAVILAAGRGTRMGNLTDDCPKPMLKVLDKNLLQWKLEALPEDINEVIFVVGYLKEVIQNYFGESFIVNEKKLKIKYIEQTELNGSMGALALCKDTLESDSSFMVLMGDDIYEKDGLKELSKHENAVLLIKQENVPGGKILVDDKGFVSGIKEGLANKGLGKEFINTGAYILNKEIFNQEPVLVKEGEYGLPQTFVERALNNKDYKVKAVFTESWINITSPESIKLAEELLK